MNDNIVRVVLFHRVTQQHSTVRKKDKMSQGGTEKVSGSWMETGYANTAAAASLAMRLVDPGLMSSVCPKKKKLKI